MFLLTFLLISLLLVNKLQRKTKLPLQRALKVRLYPENDQEIFLNAQFGAVRFAWNKALAIKNHYYKYHNQNLKPSKDIKPLLSIAKNHDKYSWLKDYDSLALQQAVINLNKAFNNFFAKRAGFPRFKKRNGKQSSYHTGGGISVDYDNSTITIPKIGEIKAKLHRLMDGKLTSITVSRTPSGKYYASLLFKSEEVLPSLPKKIDYSKMTGIDLGLKHFIIDSKFDKVINPKFFVNSFRNLKRKQKQLSRKVKGSSNRNKARIKLAKVHERIANQRLDFFYKLANKIVSENQAIILETLKVKNMMKNRKLSKHIQDVAWSKFIEILERKALEKGVIVHKINQWFASSKLCSCCGYKNEDLTLNIRHWECPECKTLHDRDINAALNIKEKGRLDLMAAGIVVSAY